MILDVGCGSKKVPGAIGIDVNPNSSADQIHDLNVIPYPYANDTFDAIVCDNCLEHLENVVAVMEELHRIAKPSASVKIIVPFYASRYAHTDPTHRHSFGWRSFDYFVPGTQFHEFRYSTIVYEIVSVEYQRGWRLKGLRRLVCRLANRFKDYYEELPCRNFPDGRHHLRVEGRQVTGCSIGLCWKLAQTRLPKAMHGLSSSR